MKPRSSNQPTESHSRRIALTMTRRKGCSVARDPQAALGGIV